MISVKIRPPRDNTWEELLRVYCQLADADDPSLPFMASMWSYAINNGGLTGKQADSANRYISHMFKRHNVSHEEPSNVSE